MEGQANKIVVQNPEQLRTVIFEHFQAIFKKVDQKSHDAVEDTELRLLIAQSLLKNVEDLSAEEFEKYKQQIDKNNTGKITYEQYFKYFFGVKAHGVATAHFEKFDKDHDKMLNKEEFRELLISTFSALNVQLTEELINWNLKTFDDNGDGKISLQEYIDLTVAYV